ncbi:MAG TPA: ABC transporter ATP-binding protein [bacterium]|nr:ABC transporter ATP-binding protein [bacterium]
MSLLETQSVHSGYGETEILHGVSLHVEPGEVVVIIGPNGAGKSTVMKTVFGLLRPTSGHVILDGEDISGLRPDKLVGRGMSYVPQTDNVFASLTIQENLEMGAFIRRDDYSAALQAVFERFPVLYERRRVRAGTLSGGERQMLAMGKALMLEPKLLLLDEPSAGLAPRLVEEIFVKVGQIAETGVGVLIIEQNAKQALKIAQRGYVMAMGEIRLEDAGATLLAHPDLASLYLGA